MNKVQILGTITRDIELRYTQSGTAIASLGIAYNEKRKQSDGSYKDYPHFFDVTAFSKKAETINQYFKKGSRILIDGSLSYESWTDQNGAKRSNVSIKLNDFDFIDKRENTTQQNSYQQSTQQPQMQYGDTIDSDEIPF